MLAIIGDGGFAAVKAITAACAQFILYVWGLDFAYNTFMTAEYSLVYLFVYLTFFVLYARHKYN